MRDVVDWNQANFGKLYVVGGLLVAFAIFALLSSRFSPIPPKLLAQTAPRCANNKLPSYFVSDPRIVLAKGGKTLLYVEGASETFGLGSPVPTALATPVPSAMPSGTDGSTPAGATSSTPAAAGGAYGNGTIGMTTVERPDAGTLLLAVAQDEDDREKGLMCVTKMAPRVGMIFVFSAETTQNFWMKNTLIPLDMIFVTDSGRVTTVASRVPSSRLDQPEVTLARRSGRGRYVIELNAGEAARDHIRPGVRLVIPHLVSED